ncbi:MAG: GGDEF domain-containing protein, partial [Pseudomonadales bacterium]
VIMPATWVYAVLGFCAILLYGLVYYLIRRSKVRKNAGPLLFIATYACLIPFMVLSGGIHSHLAYLLPLAPVFSAMVLSKGGSWIVTVGSSLLIVVMGLTVPLQGADVSIESSLSKMVWLILASFVGSGFARFFANENQALANTLKHQAQIDYLTGVLNRRGVESEIKRELELAKIRSHPIAVFMLDLDYFKRFNDVHGHMDGDICLKRVSERLSKIVARQQGIIGRYGGEEFIVALSGCGRDFAGRFAEQLRQAVSDLKIPLKRGQPELLTASVGYCIREAAEVDDINSLISLADARLYSCKKKGRNCSVGDLPLISAVPTFVSTATG